MAFKNAFKNLVAHFGVVWAVLLFILIVSAVIVGLSIPFILPVASAFDDVGVFKQISDAFASLFNDGGWNGLWNGLYAAYSSVIAVFESNSRIASLTMLFLILIAIVAFRFFFGLYEIPLTTVIDGKMSCNAKYGLGGKFFSTLSVSVRFSLAKMLVTTVFDMIVFAIAYGLGVAIGMNVALPFLLLFVFVLFYSFKCALLACWAPSVVDGAGILKGFVISIKICFKRFGSMFSAYFVTVLLLLSAGLFVTLFTLGVGLVVVVPFCAAALAYLDITEFYNKTGKRYYIDGTVFTPPSENTL